MNIKSKESRTNVNTRDVWLVYKIFKKIKKMVYLQIQRYCKCFQHVYQKTWSVLYGLRTYRSDENKRLWSFGSGCLPSSVQTMFKSATKSTQIVWHNDHTRYLSGYFIAAHNTGSATPIHFKGTLSIRTRDVLGPIVFVTFARSWTDLV